MVDGIAGIRHQRLDHQHIWWPGLGVAAQVPCRYCVVADTMFAKASGASDREIREAVAMAAIVRHWSTILNGLQADKATFKKDIERLVREAKKKSASTAQR